MEELIINLSDFATRIFEIDSSSRRPALATLTLLSHAVVHRQGSVFNPELSLSIDVDDHEFDSHYT